MTVRPILKYGHPTLRTTCDVVGTFDCSIRTLIADLADTLYSNTGIGLAAPQIGISKRVFIYDHSRLNAERRYKVLINPRIVKRDGLIISKDEGCKSVPELLVDVQRSALIEVEGLDETGTHVRFQADGLEAIVIQHEVDHLDGILLTDWLSSEERTSYETRLGNIRRMQEDKTYVNNLSAINERLELLRSTPEGVLFKQRKTHYDILVIKTGSQVQLYFSGAESKIGEENLSGIMSRIDLDAPLRLLGIYTQVMILALLWQPDPKRIYLVGFGGGRIPMIFHHYFPNVVIESTEIDPNVVSLAKRFFGIRPDYRMKVFVEDGRKYLEKNSSNTSRYDMILVDCYTGVGKHPYALSTKEFYGVCKAHLATGGVVVSNLVRSDPLFREKMHTFLESFSYVRQYQSESVDVFFGSDHELIGPEVIRRAEEAYERHSFWFPFKELAKDLRPAISEHSGITLSDESDRGKLPGGLSPEDPVFYGVGRNELCPCGSGKKFKNCHGK